jgi:hypothetical protein
VSGHVELTAALGAVLAARCRERLPRPDELSAHRPDAIGDDLLESKVADRDHVGIVKGVDLERASGECHRNGLHTRLRPRHRRLDRSGRSANAGLARAMLGEARKAGYPMADIDVNIDTNFPDRSVDDAIEQINTERSRKRLIALSGIALALLIAALSTYLAYA